MGGSSQAGGTACTKVQDRKSTAGILLELRVELRVEEQLRGAEQASGGQTAPGPGAGAVTPSCQWRTLRHLRKPWFEGEPVSQMSSPKPAEPCAHLSITKASEECSESDSSLANTHQRQSRPDSCHCRLVSPVLQPCINGIIQYGLFCLWLL